MRSPPILEMLRRTRYVVAMLAIATLGWTLTQSQMLTGLDQSLRSLRDGWRGHAASGQVVIVEVDAASTAGIGHWPFSRQVFARAIDALHAHGAKQIGVDVDFSAASDKQGDAALTAALARAGGGVVLPTFRQVADARGQHWLDFAPLPALRAHSFLAAVSILPDQDGIVRSAPTGIVAENIPRPSLAAQLAGRAGQAGASFPIDFSIDPRTIPRISLIDLINGKVDQRRIAGRTVLIGATAIEVGDRYAVPRYGVIPGVVVQAMATETLAAGHPLIAIAPAIPLVLALLAACFILTRKAGAAAIIVLAACVTAIMIGALVIEARATTDVMLAPALTILATAALISTAFAMHDKRRERLRRDEETGLPNLRALLEDCASSEHVAIAALEIINFDELANSLGPTRTKAMIARVLDRAALITAGMTIHRAKDRLFCWRLGTDNHEELQGQFQALMALMLRSVECEGRSVDVAIGLGVSAGGGVHAKEVVTQASIAALEAREHGQTWRRYDGEQHGDDAWRLSLMGQLSAAILQGEIAVHYQPKLDIACGEIRGVEALVRWNHAERGPLSPDLFIPLAEQCGRIEELTLYVLQRAALDALDWSCRGRPFNVAVNISAALLSKAGFVDSVRALLGRVPLPTAQLTFEITESATMADEEVALATLSAFRAMGIALSLDDYGTGQSTLTYLKRLPVSELKIDKSFVSTIETNRDDAALVRSTIQLAHELGLKVVAEGVETESCLNVLRQFGCDYAQGWLIGRPLQAEALFGLVAPALAA